MAPWYLTFYSGDFFMSLTCDGFQCGWSNIDDHAKHFFKQMASREPTPDFQPPPLDRKASFFDKIFSRKDSSDVSSATTPCDPATSQTTYDDPPLAPVELDGYGLVKQIMDTDLAGEIRNLAPPRLQLHDQWTLVYLLDHDGVSLNTLYRHSIPLYKRDAKKAEAGFGSNVVSLLITSGTQIPASRPLGYVLVVRDEKHQRFGAFLNEYLHPVDSRRYYGNGECFLWKTEPVDEKGEHERFKAFMYTGINDNIIFSNHNFIAIGSLNGENGLFIDKALENGVSYRCETFGNEVLNETTQVKMGRFKVYGLEIWRIG